MPTRRITFAVPAVLTLLVAAPARAQAPAPDPARSEISVFGGISLVDASRRSETTIGLPDFPGFPGFPGFPDLPSLPDFGGVQVRSETELGSSVLFGVRYGFYVKRQLAVEADFSVGPSHEIESDVEVCGPGGNCFGRGAFGASGTRDRFDGAMAGLLGGPMGGRFRGLAGMRPTQSEDGGFARGDVTAWHYGVGVTYDVLGGDVRPFVTAGAGGVSYDGDRETNTDFVLRFGGGLKAYFGRVGLRLDVTDHLVIDHYFTGEAEHDVHATAGLLVRF